MNESTQAQNGARSDDRNDSGSGPSGAVWDNQFWPRMQGPHASMVSARIQPEESDDWYPCALLDAGPQGCRVRLKGKTPQPRAGAVVQVELKPSSGSQDPQRFAMRVCEAPHCPDGPGGASDGDVDRADAERSNDRTLGLALDDGVLPGWLLMPEGGLDLEIAELELLEQHVERMWKAEQDHQKWLSIRGRVVVASTSGLLGFVAIGLIVAGADSKINLLPDAGRAWALNPLAWGLAEAGMLSALGIALGLCVCITSVVLYVWHAEEDSGVLRTRSDFGNIGRHHFETQPNLFSVYTPYLFEVVLREERMRWPGRVLKRVKCFIQGMALAVRWEGQWLEEIDRASQRRPTVARRGWLAVRLGFWTLRQALFLVAPMLRPSVIARRAMNQVYREYIVLAYERKNPRQQFIAGCEKERVERLNYPYPHDHMDTLGKLNAMYAEPLTKTSSYYLQFAEGFCKRYLGRDLAAEEGTGREGISYFDLDRLSPAIASIRPVGWRVLISTYFSAQQMRSSNWNMWYRVRRSERWFASGLIVVTASFVASAFFGVLVQRAATPVAPISVHAEGGGLLIRHHQDPPPQARPETLPEAGPQGPAW